jgi:plastocyanin
LGINNLSRIVLGIGITLSVASILSIYITSVASQNQLTSSTPSSPSQVSTQPLASNVSNSTSANTTSSTSITIPQGASTQLASLNQKYYTPANATVPSSAVITWTNKDIAPHTATANDGSFDTGIINAGSTGSATVKGKGDIQYHCNIHPWMHGSLLVSS